MAVAAPPSRPNHLNGLIADRPPNVRRRKPSFQSHGSSGSEELSRIFAKSRLRANSSATLSAARSSRDAASRSSSTTPKPFARFHDRSRSTSRVSTPLGRRPRVSRHSTPTGGLFSWIRSALVLESPNKELEQDEDLDVVKDGKNKVEAQNVVDRKGTPLLPGTLPSFYRGEDASDSALDHGEGSTGHRVFQGPSQSLETFDEASWRKLQRQDSDLTSSHGTTDTQLFSNGDDSSDEDIMSGTASSTMATHASTSLHGLAPHQSILVRPFAQRKALILNGSLDVPSIRAHSSADDGHEVSTSTLSDNAERLTKASQQADKSTLTTTAPFHGPEGVMMLPSRSKTEPFSGQSRLASTTMATKVLAVTTEDSTDSGYGTAQSRRPSEAGNVRTSMVAVDDESDAHGLEREDRQIRQIRAQTDDGNIQSRKKLGFLKRQKDHNRESFVPDRAQGRHGDGSDSPLGRRWPKSASLDRHSSLRERSKPCFSPQAVSSDQSRIDSSVSDVDPAETSRSVDRASEAQDHSRGICGRKSKGERGALRWDKQPRPIKVRHKNKSSRECEFSSLYLTQEIDLLDSTHPRREPWTSKTPLDGQTSVSSASTARGSDAKVSPRIMKFSLDGKYLAVGGQDGIIRVFEVISTPESRREAIQTSPPSSNESSPNFTAHRVGGVITGSASADAYPSRGCKQSFPFSSTSELPSVSSSPLPVFSERPVRVFKGHANEVLDLSWSKGGFLLSASMDKTAKIWHLSFDRSLASFAHGDFVTSAVFHPRDDRFFLSGSLDGKLRIWNIPSKKVHHSQELPGMITACSFTASGRTACAGLFTGAAFFYSTNGLQLVSSMTIKPKRTSKEGSKITGIEPVPGCVDAHVSQTQERVLLTSNDSNIRVYDIVNNKVLARVQAKAYSNRESQIRAMISDDSNYVVAGSERGQGPGASDGGHVVLWNCACTLAPAGAGRGLFSKLKSVKAKGTPVSTIHERHSSLSSVNDGIEPRNARDATLSEAGVEYFTAHAGNVACALMAPVGTTASLFQSGDPCLTKTVAKIRAGHEESAASAPSSRSRAFAAAVAAPLIGLQAPSKSAHTAAALLEEACKQTRVLVSVDENALLRVWRSDGMQVIHSPQ